MFWTNLGEIKNKQFQKKRKDNDVVVTINSYLQKL